MAKLEFVICTSWFLNYVARYEVGLPWFAYPSDTGTYYGVTEIIQLKSNSGSFKHIFKGDQEEPG
jgi:hypothetical protein